MTSSTPAAAALAARIKQQRLERGLTQAQLATMAAIEVSTYRYFEQVGEISLGRLVRVFDALGLAPQIDQLATSQTAPVNPAGLLSPARQRGRRRASGGTPRAVAPDAPKRPATASTRGVEAHVKGAKQSAKGGGAGDAGSAQPVRPPIMSSTPVATTAAVVTMSGQGRGPAQYLPAQPPADWTPGMVDADRRRFQNYLRQAIRDIIRGGLPNDRARNVVQRHLEDTVDRKDGALFIAAVQNELRRLTPADIEPYDIHPREFATWQETWKPEIGIGAF